jgi:hypothetical protein
VIEPEQERFEADLRRSTPAPVPADLMKKLRSAANSRRKPRVASPSMGEFVRLLRAWRWALAGLPVALVILALGALHWLKSPGASRPAEPSNPQSSPDFVRVDRALVASFEAVAELPDGVPVRFRCRKWMDEVQMKDESRGLVIEERIPRLEVVPVGLETY